MAFNISIVMRKKIFFELSKNFVPSWRENTPEPLFCNEGVSLLIFDMTTALISDYSIKDVLDAVMAVMCALTYEN